MNCFRGEGGADAPVDSRALLFFVNDLCALTIEAAQRHVGAFAACVDGSHAWSLPQVAIIGKAPFKLEGPDRQLITSLALRAHVGPQTASIGDLVLRGGVVAAALSDLTVSGVSPTAEACVVRVRTELGVGRAGSPTPFFTTVAGFVRELAALAAWLAAFDPTTTLAVPARSVEQEAWVLSQDDAPCGKILVMPGSCGIAGTGGVGVLFAPVGPVLVRRGAVAHSRAADEGSPSKPSALLSCAVLQKEWSFPSNGMESLAVLPIGTTVAPASSPAVEAPSPEAQIEPHTSGAAAPASVTLALSPAAQAPLSADDGAGGALNETEPVSQALAGTSSAHVYGTTPFLPLDTAAPPDLIAVSPPSLAGSDAVPPPQPGGQMSDYL